jgi:protein gp37
MAVSDSSIEWTDSTWNPVTGCDKVSPGCAHCYAETFAKRGLGTFAGGRPFTDVQCHEDRVTQPLRWRRPRKVFVNSMSDLFHDDVPDAFIDRVFAVMALAPQHTFQILTKRAERMRAYLAHERKRKVAVAAQAFNMGKTGPAVASKLVEYQNYDAWPLPNVWLGVSVENNRWRSRLDELLVTPAAVRFISAEPLLDELDLTAYLEGDTLAAPGPGGFRKGPRLDWVIVGGESGAGARPCDIAWVLSIVKQCQAAGVPVFVKQLGSKPVCTYAQRGLALGVDPASIRQMEIDEPWNANTPEEYPIATRKGGDLAEMPEDLRVREFPTAVPA